MLTGEDVRVRGQKRRMREEMTLPLTLTLTLTWDASTVRPEIESVAVLPSPVEQKGLVPGHSLDSPRALAEPAPESEQDVASPKKRAL